MPGTSCLDHAWGTEARGWNGHSSSVMALERGPVKKNIQTAFKQQTQATNSFKASCAAANSKSRQGPRQLPRSFECCQELEGDPALFSTGTHPYPAPTDASMPCADRCCCKRILDIAQTCIRLLTGASNMLQSIMGPGARPKSLKASYLAPAFLLAWILGPSQNPPLRPLIWKWAGWCRATRSTSAITATS